MTTRDDRATATRSCTTPAPVDGALLPSLLAGERDRPYRVVLTNVSAPAIGTLLVNTESKPVGGRVVAVEEAAGQLTVTLALVSMRDMFPNASIPGGELLAADPHRPSHGRAVC